MPPVDAAKQRIHAMTLTEMCLDDGVDNMLDAARIELGMVLQTLPHRRAGRLLKRFPSRFSTYLWHRYSGLVQLPIYDVSLGPNHAIRQIHDYYGWQAKPGKHGHCAGALYRSLGFLSLPSSARNGKRGPMKTVHIEHLIPVSVLCKVLETEIHHFPGPSQLHSRLLALSICVAMTQHEAEMMPAASVSRSTSPCFDARGNLLGAHPFLRYRGLVGQRNPDGIPFRIFNIVTKTEVCLERFTLADHSDTLTQAGQLVDDPSHPIYDI